MKIAFKDDADGFYQTDLEEGQELPAWAKGMTRLSEDERLSESLKQEGVGELLSQIRELEVQATPRRIREASIGTDKGWMKNLDAQIAVLRAKLPKAS